MLVLNSEISTFLAVLNVPIKHTSAAVRVSFSPKYWLGIEK